ncbi:hypothetical protein [Paenibacillus polymyxa]|uniref:hypothetical protein n=1 Tax=Paenibacillus polymyxa TaxID=1406 RepID=UPI002AB4CB04|nr:hypothetical protein [Paenibacillus polymyxa]MDY8024315.1 hypothetical protein [Paenibacillus polymyxa]
MVLPTSDQFGSTRMDLVTEAKSNTVAYERHGTPATDRGRYRKKRTKVVLGRAVLKPYRRV